VRHNGQVNTWLLVFSVTVLIISSFALGALILLHKGRGEGVTDVFGTGLSTAVSGSRVGERNLTRWTVAMIVIWVLAVSAIGYYVSITDTGREVQISETNTNQP